MSQYSSYYLYQKYEKRGEQDWIPCYPNTYSISGDSSNPMSLVVKTENDPNCGYVPSAEYRWVDLPISTNWICDECPSPPPTSGQYLTFVAQEAGTFSFSGTSANTVEYSLDSGSTWTTLASGTDSPTVSAGNKIMWKGSYPQYSVGRFNSSGQFTVEGNIMSLVYGDNFSGQTSLSSGSTTFRYLFYQCSGLTSIDNLVLPATTLNISCYDSMFSETSLTTVPSDLLPATALTNYCYSYMFAGCTSLTTVPQLPATTLANNCYYNMFNGCTSLTTVPSGLLPATTMAKSCYYEMFSGCTSLTTAPELPATTLANGCYNSMFWGCTSLTTAPSLPATTLDSFCYDSMFRSCTSLTTAPELPATTLRNYCYYGMFSGCTSLNYIKCMATDISAYHCTYYWTDGVASSGTFVKASSMNDWPSGINGIPDNWTVQNA